MLDFDQLDRTIHEKGRLSIMSLLASRPSWPYPDLKKELKMSDGNLVSHLKTLHQAGYVAVLKEVLDRPSTKYSLTDKGRKSFQSYLDLLEKIIQQSRPN